MKTEIHELMIGLGKLLPLGMMLSEIENYLEKNDLAYDCVLNAERILEFNRADENPNKIKIATAKTYFNRVFILYFDIRWNQFELFIDQTSEKECIFAWNMLPEEAENYHEYSLKDD